MTKSATSISGWARGISLVKINFRMHRHPVSIRSELLRIDAAVSSAERERKDKQPPHIGHNSRPLDNPQPWVERVRRWKHLRCDRQDSHCNGNRRSSSESAPLEGSPV